MVVVIHFRRSPGFNDAATRTAPCEADRWQSSVVLLLHDGCHSSQGQCSDDLAGRVPVAYACSSGQGIEMQSYMVEFQDISKAWTDSTCTEVSHATFAQHQHSVGKLLQVPMARLPVPRIAGVASTGP